MALGYYCKSCGVFDENGVANHKCVANTVANSVANNGPTSDVSVGHHEQRSIRASKPGAARKRSDESDPVVHVHRYQRWRDKNPELYRERQKLLMRKRRVQEV